MRAILSTVSRVSATRRLGLLASVVLIGAIAATACGDDTTATVPTTTAALETHTPVYVTVAYRSDPVDIAHPAFEYLDTSGSSLVRRAWYDDDTGYMVINLNGTYYHYCGMPISAWFAFGDAASFGSYYNSSIQGRYDCRSGFVPDY